MREVKDKSKFYIYRDTVSFTFPPDRIWKIWVPLPETMFKGMWLQCVSFDEAIKIALMSPEELDKMLNNLFKNDGGW